MKKLFEKYGQRLSRSEQEELWRRITTPPRRRFPVRWIFRPVFVTATVSLAALFIFLLINGRDTTSIGPDLGDLAEREAGRLRTVSIGDAVEVDKSEDLVLGEKADAGAEVQPKAAAKPVAPSESTAVVPPVVAHRPAVATADRKPGVGDQQSPVQAQSLTGPDAGQRAPSLSPGDSLYGVIRLTVTDADSGEPLPYAEVVIGGHAAGTFPIWGGVCVLRDLRPGREYHLQVHHLGYTSQETAVAVTGSDTVNVAVALPVEIVDTLAAFDVEGAKYMVEVKGAGTEQRIAGDKFRKYAIDSVEEVLAKKAGTVMRAGEIHVRGGRSGETSMRIDGGKVNDPLGGGGSPAPAARTSPNAGLRSVRDERDVQGEGIRKGGCIRLPRHVWVPPNDQAFDAMYFEHYGVNPFIVTEEDALSTFALDVDNASYTVTRRYLRDGLLPPRDAVRVEEFVNFFDQDYGEVCEGDFAIHADGAPSPFGEGYHLLRIGVQGREVSTHSRKPAHLVFVIDVSGSMRRENRLTLVKRALAILLNELDEGDTVGIVVYGSHGRVVLEPTSVADRKLIELAIDSLVPGGSTNADEGLYLGYEMARSHFVTKEINRIILCSDGVANQSRTGADDILAHVRREADAGIYLSTIGFGMGNYNDVLLEKLADRGDGNYYYVDEISEAKRVFHENLTGTLQTIARDVKVQVEFNPKHVLRYRLLGYENRDVADRDFRNDAVDAGEVGAGHRVTALYEVKLAKRAVRHLTTEQPRRSRRPRLATIRLRYEIPANASQSAGEVREIERTINTRDLSGSFGGAAHRLQLSAVVAEFAEILRGSYWAKESKLDALVPMADRLAGELQEDAAVIEFRQLLRRAAAIVAREQDWEE